MLFKYEGLSITIEANVIETYFLDVSFNLEMDKSFPYRKPKNTPFYIYSQLNHPPFITEQLSLMINRCISNFSCNENKFSKTKYLYKLPLKTAGLITV